MSALSLQQPRLRHFQAMGGPCDLAVFDAPDSLLDRLEAEVMRLEQRYSRYLPGSLVSAINQSAGTVQFVDEECAGLLNYADHCFRLSEGLFDITSVASGLGFQTPGHSGPRAPGNGLQVDWLGASRLGR